METPPSPNQPNEDPALRDFFRFIASEPVLSVWCHELNQDLTSPFIPYTKLFSYFEKNLKGILKALLPDDDPGKAPDVNSICKDFSKTFAILLHIDRGRDISWFLTKGDALTDSHLPYESRPRHWPSSQDDNDFNRFLEKQWLFCAVQFDRNRDIDFHDRRILPITSKEVLGEGGSAIVHKARIYEEYNLLSGDHGDVYHENSVICHSLTATNKLPRPDVVVVKSYVTSDAQKYYKNELQAYRRLHPGKNWSRNLLGFYSAFQHQGHYNIIVEHANKGTLEEILHNMDPPSKCEDRLKLWDGLLKVATGLITIHGSHKSADEDSYFMAGWHQDLKPSNIFVFQDSTNSNYGLHFKIGDLNISHFHRHSGPSQGMQAPATPGTYTYGAPECDSADLKIRVASLLVLQNVDIWSLGCIYSVVATWIWGRPMVREYADQRSQEIQTLTGKSNRDCFHANGMVLPCVSEHHSNLTKHLPAVDRVTAPVLNELVSKMLTKQEGRPTAVMIGSWSVDIISRAKVDFAEPRHRTKKYHGKHVSRSRVITASEPNTDSLESDQILSRHAGARSRVQHNDGQATVESEEEHTADEDDEDAPGHHNYSLSEQAPAVPRNQVQPTKQLFSRSRTSPTTSSSHEVLGKHSELATLTRQALPSRTPSVRNTEHLTSHGGSAARTNLTLETTRPPSEASVPTTRTEAPVLNDTNLPRPTQLPRQSLSQGSQSGLEEHRSATIAATKPYWTLKDGLDWKKSMNSAGLLDEGVIEHLRNREHVLLVDDGSTMSRNKQQLREALEFISHVVTGAGYDPNGLDLYFRSSSKKFNCKDSNAVIRALDEAAFRGYGDMKGRFREIIEGYKAGFNKTHRFKALWDKTQPSKGPRKLSLYIFTDGSCLEHNDLQPIISGLVKQLKMSFPDDQVGIQFIRFGNHKIGLERLKYLDEGLKKEIHWDIIDTTSADGNVYKMLVGAFDDSYDADDEQLYTPPSTPHQLHQDEESAAEYNSP